MDEATIKGKLAELRGWQYTDGMLRKTYRFPDFVEALAWVVRVGFIAEKFGHHPDIDIRWNKVTLALVTHDAGNTITQKDLDVAGAANTIEP